jgi:hypothetical protein
MLKSTLFILKAIPDIVMIGSGMKPVLSPTYMLKLRGNKPCDIIHPVLRAESHISAKEIRA